MASHTTKTTTTTTRTTKTRPHCSIFSRKKKATVAVHHQKRKPTLGDKVAGAAKKIKGTILGHSGEKAAGTRRMHGTDGRGVRRSPRFL